MVFDNVRSRMFPNSLHSGMFPRDVFIMVFIAVTLLLVQGGQSQDLKKATACYGNVNNYLRLDCPDGYYIHVLRVIHGAKPKSAECVSPASISTYRKECCGIHSTDCSLTVQDGASLQCENKTNCDAVATWSTTNKGCDQDEYPHATNYMLMEYMCRRKEAPQTSTTTSTKDTTSSSSSTSSSPPSSFSSSTSSSLLWSLLTSNSSSSTTTTAKSTSDRSTNATTAFPGKTPAAYAQPSNREKKDDEMSDAMIGAIVGGCLGMLLTFVIFIFYWGRKRRLRIVGKPQPSVWDYLLSQTFTVRGAKGYDHFSSVRSSASSEGDPNSPVIRKNMWLPNIVDKDNSCDEDIISNYNNDTDKNHRVEIYHNATPSPYAILDLSVSNLRQDNNHDV